MAKKAAAEAQVHVTLVDRLMAPLKRMQARLALMSKRLGFDRIGRAAGDLTRRIGGLGQALGRSTSRLGLFAGALGVGGAGAAFAAFKLAQRTASLGDEIAKTSRQLGLGAEALQEYRYAADLSGVSAQTFQDSTERLGRNAVMASEGNKKLAGTFRSLGVSLTDANGNMRSTETILDDTLAALAAIEDPLIRSQRAYELFGRSGVDMVKMLAGGPEALRALREEARRTGHVISQEAAEFSEVFGDNITRLQRRFDGLRNMIGVNLMPIMNEVVVKLTEWYDANALIVRQKIADWVGRFAQVIRDLMNPASEIRQEISRLAESATKLLDRIRPVVEFLGGPMQAGLIAVAAWITGPLIAAVTMLAASFVNLGLVILTTPIGWILGGLALMGAAAYVLIQRWDDFVGYWQNLWTRITDAFDEGFLQGFLALWKEFNPVVHIARGIDAVFEYFTGISLIEEGAALSQSLVDGIASVAFSLHEWLAGNSAELETYLAGKLADFTAWGSSIGVALWQGVTSSVFDLAEWVAEKFDAAVAYLAGLPRQFYQAGADIVTGLWDGIKAQWGALKSWFAGAVSDLLPSWTPDWIKDRLGFTGAPEAPQVAPARPTAVTAPTLAPTSLDTLPPPPSAQPANLTAPNAAPPTVQADELEAGSVKAAEFIMPEPLIAHEPQQIDASVRIENLTVQGGQGTPAEIREAVSSALAEHSRRQKADLQSSLSD